VSPTVAVVAAVARNGVVGRRGALPWHLPEDMAHFRAVTIGHPVVMGRTTWESLPEPFRPLPGRRNIVVTRQPDWHAEGATRAGSVAAALEIGAGDERVSVIGGADLYEQVLPLADELLLTELDVDVEGDRFFPAFDRDAFREVSREKHVSASGVPFAFVTYVRAAR
jgi:dihydrofolate reductase